MVIVAPQLRPIRGYGSTRAADENVTVHKERALKKSVALLLGFAALGVAGAETAAAQGLYYGPGFYGHRYYVPGLAPWRVARIVRSAGLTPLSAPARRGPIYEVVAIDPEGRHMRVAVDAYRGAITSVRPVAVLRPNGEPYGSRVAVAPPPEQDDMVPDSRFSPNPAQPGAGRIPPQVLPPYGGPSQGLPSQGIPSHAMPSQGMPQQAVQPPQAAQPAPTPRVANAPVITGATTPVESQRTPIPRPRPSAAATAAVTSTPSSSVPSSSVPSSSAPSSASGQAPASSAAATAAADVPEAPPAPIRARPSAPAAPAAAAASASAKAPAAAASTSAATAKTEPRLPTTLVPVAPLE
jgi:hypothetical protein